jgi:hypothetical protein
MSTISIGCRLPNGLIIDLGDATKPSIELAGQRQAQENSPIVLLNESHYGVTEVDESYWEAWKKHVGPEFAPLKSQAIFEAKNEKEAKAKAKDLKEVKTGHEPLKQEVGDIKKA